jgi:hypothetical protein
MASAPLHSDPQGAGVSESGDPTLLCAGPVQRRAHTACSQTASATTTTPISTKTVSLEEIAPGFRGAHLRW